MNRDPERWRQYLFESHSEETLRAWARRLHLFRFFRAYGGHANDGDSLDVVYRYRSVEELERFLTHVGAPIAYVAERPVRPQDAVAGHGKESARPPALVPGTKGLQQPGRCSIANQQAFVWCERDTIKISLGAGYQVAESHVQAAEVIEKVLLEAPLPRVEPPVDNEHCICPKFYPAYFS